MSTTTQMLKLPTTQVWRTPARQKEESTTTMATTTFPATRAPAATTTLPATRAPAATTMLPATRAPAATTRFTSQRYQRVLREPPRPSLHLMDRSGMQTCRLPLTRLQLGDSQTSVKQAPLSLPGESPSDIESQSPMNPETMNRDRDGQSPAGRGVCAEVSHSSSLVL